VQPIQTSDLQQNYHQHEYHHCVSRLLRLVRSGGFAQPVAQLIPCSFARRWMRCTALAWSVWWKAYLHDSHSASIADKQAFDAERLHVGSSFFARLATFGGAIDFVELTSMGTLPCFVAAWSHHASIGIE